jgi:hypothetical protein
MEILRIDRLVEAVGRPHALGIGSGARFARQRDRRVAGGVDQHIAQERDEERQQQCR